MDIMYGHNVWTKCMDIIEILIIPRKYVDIARCRDSGD